MPHRKPEKSRRIPWCGLLWPDVPIEACRLQPRLDRHQVLRPVLLRQVPMHCTERQVIVADDHAVAPLPAVPVDPAHGVGTARELLAPEVVAAPACERVHAAADALADTKRRGGGSPTAPVSARPASLMPPAPRAAAPTR